MAGSLEIKVISEKLAYVYGGDADGVALMGLDVVADGAIEVRVLLHVQRLRQHLLKRI